MSKLRAMLEAFWSVQVTAIRESKAIYKKDKLGVKMNRLFQAAAFTSFMMIAAAPAQARITQLEILRTEPAFGGESFGHTGAYVRIFARAHGELDPGASNNKIIQDIELAPRNCQYRLKT
ncbi:Uncharacterized protein ALO38_04841, partial [Pseudomonas coronafaciens pv. zizaniae]